VQQTLGREVEQDRFTRLDRTILEEVNEQGLVDLRIGEQQSWLGGANRYLLIERLKKLERMGLAHEEAPSRWLLGTRVEKTLRELGDRVHLVIDGADGRAHYVELGEAAASDVRTGRSSDHRPRHRQGGWPATSWVTVCTWSSTAPTLHSGRNSKLGCATTIVMSGWRQLGCPVFGNGLSPRRQAGDN
jgi:type IV secretory pathway VirD2 relaxase